MPVRLRPFEDADVPVLRERRRHAETDDPFDFFGHTSFTPPSIGPDSGSLAVDVDGVLAGEVSWRPVQYGLPPWSTAFEIGVALAPGHRGHGVGTEAQRLLLAYLFAHTRVHRVQATTDVENVAEQRALEKAGFAREGVLRGAQWRGGAWHDLVLYAAVRA